jgi:hypothetical protein
MPINGLVGDVYLAGTIPTELLLYFLPIEGLARLVIILKIGLRIGGGKDVFHALLLIYSDNR